VPPVIQSKSVEVYEKESETIDLKGLSIFQDISLGQCWKNSTIALLWNLWEIMITETPLLIIADTPAEASYDTY